MLSEHVVASIHTPIKAPASGAKDVSIFAYETQPLPGQRQVYKKSATNPNCLAVSATHIFAAQAEKAVVHVYNRAKGNHEATIPFNERITSLTLAASDSVLILGTESGRITAWEVPSGRLVSTPQAHLQAISALVIDPSSNHLISGSLDSSIYVWSLASLLSFSHVESVGANEARSPVHSLSNHRGAITSLAIGHVDGAANILVSASEDKSVLLWNYQQGTALRTHLLRDVPKAVELDICDRGFYTVYADGSVQLVDFYADSSRVHAFKEEAVPTPAQPGDVNLWQTQGQDLGEGLCLALSWDGTRLLSGHKTGKIASWDTSTGAFIGLLDTVLGPVTNIVPLPLEGLERAGPHGSHSTDIVKPRLAATDISGAVSGDYTFSAQLQRDETTSRAQSMIPAVTSFQYALQHASIPSDLLLQGIAELVVGDDNAAASSASIDDNADILPLSATGSDNHDLSLKEKNEQLLEQIAHLQKLQKASFGQLRDKTRIIKTLVSEQEKLVEVAKIEHNWVINDAGVEWESFRTRQNTKKSGKAKMNGRKHAAALTTPSNGTDEEMADDSR